MLIFAVLEAVVLTLAVQRYLSESVGPDFIDVPVVDK
jgi:hypothetical protein